MNNPSLSQKIYSYLLSLYQWYLRTSERSLDEAYKAALQIKAIEDEHFNGNKIDFNSSMYSGSIMDFFEADLRKQLNDARMRLTEFRTSRYFLNETNKGRAARYGVEYPDASVILEKLKFIDEVISKYSLPDQIISPRLAPNSSITVVPLDKSIVQDRPKPLSQQFTASISDKKTKTKANTTGLLPRSILGTISRLQVELDPKSENDVVQNFRQSQRRTIISVRFLLLLVIVPLLTHQLSKTFFVGPLVDKFRNEEEVRVFLNQEMEEEGLMKLEHYEEKLKFQNMINSNPLTAQEIEEKLKKEAAIIAEEFKGEGNNAVKNVFADICSVIAFIWLLIVSKREIAVLKEFFDNVVYGLSDSAKAFLIILFTDVFVGFHSPHGWEVILEGLAKHWGIPAIHSYIFLFIATFPVILDTIFKYWIFRYLNRISPSAVATYHNMNE
jgi:CemA family